MRWVAVMTGVVLAGVLGGCPSASTSTNPFLQYSETFGITGKQQEPNSTSAGTGTQQQATFRRALKVTFRNNNPAFELNTSFIAWVNLNSIRSADQQDALLKNGYAQLTQAVVIGTGLTLPSGTFVYNGSGTAGATTVFLAPASGEPNQTQDPNATGTQVVDPNAPTQSLSLITPDGMLMFSAPPISCDSIAFWFGSNGEPSTGVPAAVIVGNGSNIYGGATTTGGFKTLAQVSAYQCDPFKPGLFFSSGGAKQANQYFEGDDVTFDFFRFFNPQGKFCTVTIGTQTTTTTTTGTGGGTAGGTVTVGGGTSGGSTSGSGGTGGTGGTP